ncbi:MAG: hypothetical protein KDA61_07250, partial [Planctomycetales bacterium]|nr:hypothetical protein [Planctomycetales bacterium]
MPDALEALLSYPDNANPATAAETSLISASTIGSSPTVSASSLRTVRVLHVINGEHYSGAERVQDL